MSEYVKTIGQIKGQKRNDSTEKEVQDETMESEPDNLNEAPFQFDRMLKALKQKVNINHDDDDESTTTDSTMRGIQLQNIQNQVNPIRAKSKNESKSLLKQEGQEEEKGLLCSKRLKKISMLFLYMIILLLGVHAMTGFGSNCKIDQTWDISIQSCVCDSPWEENKRGQCVHKCPYNQKFNLTDETCSTCPISYQHVEKSNNCTDRCTSNQIFADNECQDCPNFWQYVISENKCVDRCQNGKSFNRYFDDDIDSSCIDMYDAFEEIGLSNEILQSHVSNNILGGPLTEELQCGVYATNIKTPFSERMYSTDNYQYIEFISSLNPQLAYYEKTRMFVSTKDFKTIDLIIDTEDNTNNQCYNEGKACWQELINLQHQDDIFIISEGFESDGTNTLIIEGQWRFGQDAALIRMSNSKGSKLVWQRNNLFNGKKMEITKGETSCNKQLFRDNEDYGTFEGSNMIKPF